MTMTLFSDSPRRLLSLALCACVPLGCYTGLDGDGQADPSAADDAGVPPGANDDGPSREPASDDPAPPFRVPNAEARLLPFPVRMQNLAHVTGHDLEHPMFLELYTQRYLLGDHDFASGVAPDLRWSADKMQAWVRGLEPVCEAAELQAAYPDLLTDPRPMMRQAWGREPTAAEVEALGDLQGDAIALERQFSMTCIAVLTALDFVAV